MSSIAQEIVDEIVDHLRGDDASLRSCALASRTFVNPCQRHLFQVIALSYTRQASRLSSILHASQEQSGHLARIPQSLYLAGEIFNDSTYLPHLLASLKSISAVSLYGIDRRADVRYDRRRWETIPKDLREALSSLVGRRQVRSLGLRHISFPPQTLNNLGTMDSLLISSAVLDIDDDHDDSGTSLQNSINITSLTFASQMQSWAGIQVESASASQAIGSTSSSLRNLTLNWGVVFSGLTFAARNFEVLRDCLGLEVLRIERRKEEIQRCYDFYAENRVDTGLYEVVELLQLVSSDAPIRSVHVDIVLEEDSPEDVYGELDLQLSNFARRGAEVFVSVFMGFSQYKSLVVENPSSIAKEFWTRLESLLPRTRESGPGQLIIHSALSEI